MKIYPMLLAFALVACASSGKQSSVPTSKREASATLGVATGIPSKELAQEMGLEFQIRQQGRLVESVATGSAADKAGVHEGDVLLKLGDVTLYSQDDIDDFVSIHKPSSEIRATLVRAATGDREQLTITLGQGPARPSGTLRWQYASLAQLPDALRRARTEKKKVLVGLSGAET